MVIKIMAKIYIDKTKVKINKDKCKIDQEGPDQVKEIQQAGKA